MRKILLGIILGGILSLLFYLLKQGVSKEKAEPHVANNSKLIETFMKKMDNQNKHFALIFFTTGDCPLCKNYRPYIKKLMDSLGRDTNWITFVYRMDSCDSTIAPNTMGYSYPFSKKDNYDQEAKVASIFGATVTPQVFVLGRKKQILYSGAIDNWAYETGKHRPKATEFYLDSVVNQIQRGESVKPWSTSPVGCYIEKGEDKQL